MASNEDTEDVPASESKAQRDARLRRERRNAKIVAGGSERLNKITSLSGRPAAAEAGKWANQPSQHSLEGLTVAAELQKDRTPSPSGIQKQHNQSSDSSANHEDPAEVDISNMIQKPQEGTFGLQTQEEMLRRMLRAPENGSDANQQEGTSEDPMMQMMQQMLSPGGNQQSGSGDLPSGLAAMFGGGAQEEGAQGQSASSADYVWRIVHTILSLLLGLYAASVFAFTGSKLARDAYVDGQLAPRVFWIFATAELILQSTRYFVDKGRLPPSSTLGKFAAMLPQPYANYLRVLSRYSIIYTTVASDALVIVFVLGAMAWWKGLVDA
ncbi:MAG: hypothetical protein M1831_001471 [Alyxoria varia]|nr:MAG: hypothetical protein M1831_001471 [Alyxoria varia]